MSSAKVVYLVKKSLQTKKVGHAGTLDPLATGVLPIAVGEALKTIHYAMDGLKEYIFTVTFGEERDTGDAEGVVIATSEMRPSREQIIKVLPEFLGEVQQVPPIYSALKINGQRAYDLARAGQEVVMKARQVHIYAIELISTDTHYNCLSATIKVKCGKGTYIRSLAKDLAIRLGTVGYMSYLTRTLVGNFLLEDAISLDKLEELVHNRALSTKILAIDAVLDDIPVLKLTRKEVEDLRFGRTIIRELSSNNSPFMKAIDEDDCLIALVRQEDNCVKPFRVFNY